LKQQRDTDAWRNINKGYNQVNRSQNPQSKKPFKATPILKSPEPIYKANPKPPIKPKAKKRSSKKVAFQESTNPSTIDPELVSEPLDLPPKIKWSSNPADFPKITNELYFGSLIGEGSFAKVFEGFDKSKKRRVAIKVIKKKVYMDKKKEYLMQNEVDIMWATRKVPEIVQVSRVLEDYKRVSIQSYTIAPNFLRYSL
jgi:hypothetical protein